MEPIASRSILNRFSERLATEPQQTIIEEIKQFSEATIHAVAQHDGGCDETDALRILVFNIERGVHLQETIDFLKYVPDSRPFDVILANELDDGCERSENRDVAQEIACALHMDYVFGLEFLELVGDGNDKGYHGNAVFSRWPILWAKTIRLPEQYNWYFDRQRRIGGRNAVLAKLDIGENEIGVASIHLENRTTGVGRSLQMRTVLDAVERYFGDLPVVLGGDFNTNGFDGSDIEEICALIDSPQAFADRSRQLERYEPLLGLCSDRGYLRCGPSTDSQQYTRRKTIPKGGFMPLRLDWLFSRGFTVDSYRIASTLTEDCKFAPEGSALAQFKKSELSDHNAVWARYKIHSA